MRAAEAVTADPERLRISALAWLADDPDPETRAELAALIEALPASTADLTDRFAGRLRFGTAGLRGPLRAGPNGMNLAVVRATAAGLVAWLRARNAEGPVVIGYDARHGSRAFAEETARVVTGARRVALLLPEPLPTPVLAAAVRRQDAVAGVMVTASHNPPQDNGYKVYLGQRLGGPAGAGAQLVSPADAEIEAAIRAVGPLAEVPLGGPGTVLGVDTVDAYTAAAAAVATTASASRLTVAYTPLHGVGGQPLAEVLTRAGFAAPLTVTEQFAPDPDFPTVAYPNPEEPGVMDRVLALGSAHGADLAIANDPDADRCAVAVADPATGTWRVLRGDELGILLADHLMRRGVSGRYATTIASSTLLSRLCAARGMPYGETLTGFKWIMRAGTDLVFGYEEALGYCVAPALVRDKDGITAALLACELAAELAETGRTPLDRLDELAVEFGVHATDQLSVRVNDLAAIAAAMATIRARPPEALLGQPVTQRRDLLPDAEVFLTATATARSVVRPSGTEPKLKAYLEVVEPAADGDTGAARERAAVALARLRAETAGALGLD
ncbi:MAG: phospho-sugar mutase [Dactylosporangium sp.]|nr:phospho-sugar mutase [Dactylosporangium sp.]NNJ63425.1 phospho-sugar mutase [Dactylosporangium sp.]